MKDTAAISLLFFFTITTLLIIFAYYTTRWIGSKTALIARNRHIALLEKVILSGGISIQAIKVGSKVYLIAGQGKELIVLDKLSETEWHANRPVGEMTDDKTGAINFPQVISRLMTGNNPKIEQKGPQEGDYD